MSEKVKFEPKGRNKPQKNISKAKSISQKPIITRSSQTPFKSQSHNKIFINNNNNTMINPNNNYNINNNISININIDMTNERNKSFNLKNKSQSKKRSTNTKKEQNYIKNNSLIINALKNINNKSNLKKSPFHIRIQSANLNIKDFKYKPNNNQKNKVYQNRLNYYYNISNKNNFNIFSHKFETKKPENNITEIEHKNISINHTPIIDKTNKVYKNVRDKKFKKLENIIVKTIPQEQKEKNKKNNNNINVNKNINIKKNINKRNIYSQNLNIEILKKKKNKIQSTTPDKSPNTQLNRSIDNRKLKSKNINKNNNYNINKINKRNTNSSPFIHNKKPIHYTIDYDKNKNKMNKKNNAVKSPVNFKFNNNIFKNNYKFNLTGTNFASPKINNKNINKLHIDNIKHKDIIKEKNIKKDNNDTTKEKKNEQKEGIKIINKNILENNKNNIEEKENEIKKQNKKQDIENKENKELDNNKSNLKTQIDDNEKDKNKKEIENGTKIEEKKEKLKQKKDDLKEDLKGKEEEKKEEKKEEINQIKIQKEVSSFLDELFQQSIPLEIPPSIPQQSPKTKKITNLQSICKIGYAGPGIKKKNQDNFFIYKNFLKNPDLIFLGVCDGHGMFGHDISAYLVNNLPQNLHSAFLKENLSTINNESEFKKISDIASNVFVQTNLNLVNNASIDCTYSGTTCSSLIFSPEKIISLNVGDSRCVLGKFINDKWSAKNLTRDHKPTEEDEKKRILEKGGRIEAYKDETGEAVGPERVWLKGEDLPGLAMSRSFGDDVAHMIGVTSKPEILEYKLCEEDKFIMLASDGIFEFITSDEAVNMVKDYYLKDDIDGALNYLYKISSQRWIMEEEAIDDITLIIIFLG